MLCNKRKIQSILLHIATSLRKLGRRTTARTPYCWLSNGGGGKNRLRKSECVSPLDLPCNFLYHKSDHVRFEERTGDEKALLLHIAIRLRKFGGRTTAQRSRCWLFSEGYRGRRKVGIADGFRLCQFFKTEIRSDPKSLNEDREYCFQKKRNLHPCSVARRTPTPNASAAEKKRAVGCLARLDRGRK
jgi:hypothetical protein